MCKEQAPVVKHTKGYTIDVQFAGKVQSLTIAEFKRQLSRVKMEDVQRLLGMEKHPSEYIVNNIMVASPVIRPDRRV